MATKPERERERNREIQGKEGGRERGYTRLKTSVQQRKQSTGGKCKATYRMREKYLQIIYQIRGY